MSAVDAMLAKLANRGRSRGYVTQIPEVTAIFAELTPRLSASVIETYDDGDLISIEITVGFSLSHPRSRS
jgi:hypothetical protein